MVPGPKKRDNPAAMRSFGSTGLVVAVQNQKALSMRIKSGYGGFYLFLIRNFHNVSRWTNQRDIFHFSPLNIVITGK